MRTLKTMDGNAAAAHVAYAFSEVAAIYPITPSSPMAENMDEWVSQERKNIFGEKVKIVEMQSEAGAAGAVHGSMTAGALTSTFTASQGLLLMIPNMYKLAGEQMPTVFHVAARCVASHSLNIFGDHSDVMACRQTGFAMLASNSVQQTMDLAAVAHLSTIKGSVPMLHFFDGFRTSHEQQKIEIWDYDELKAMADWNAVNRFKASALNPNHPYTMGSAEQPDTFFQHREACNTLYQEMPDIVNAYMQQVNAKIGTDYHPFNYYGATDATDVIVAMGSVCECAEEVIDWLTAKGKKVGIIEVHLFRPWSSKYFFDALPKTVQRIAVLDRTKEPGSNGEPLFKDIVMTLKGTEFDRCMVCGGRYGLGSKDVQPGDILAVYENLQSETPKKEFTLSIIDDVTHLSLEGSCNPDVSCSDTRSYKFWGLGSDGTVGANKNAVKIIGDHTDMKVQAYFQYDSKKSGGVTISHLRFSHKPIKSTYYIKQADFVACHNVAYLFKYDMVKDIKPGGIFLLNCTWDDDMLEQKLPGQVKRKIAENKIRFYTINAAGLAKDIGLGARRTNMILQAAFFWLTDVLPIDRAEYYMKEAVKKSYGKKGANVVDMNYRAIQAGYRHVHNVVVPESWRHEKDWMLSPVLNGRDNFHTDFLNDILVPYNHLEGDQIPVSKFLATANGMMPNGTAAFEKRRIAPELPYWDPQLCMQCNWCSTVCPHGVVRPFALTEEEAEQMEKASDSGQVFLPMKGSKNYRFTLGWSLMDCTGCGSCAEVCPARKKAITMLPEKYDDMVSGQETFDYLYQHIDEKPLPFKTDSVKGAQFKTPLMEFSGACAGCGESPYAKLITQLFGDRMFIANATGCSSIWGASLPATPYTVNKDGKGPAWANSLFEDNAEFGFGMAISISARRNEMRSVVQRLAESGVNEAADWVAEMDQAEGSKIAGDALLAVAKSLCGENEDAQYIIDHQDMLVKPSMWIFGGDGWAYDIGYGGLDHVLASGENVNIMVFDTEVYSNTGGQSSKATPIGAVAKFASSGKAVKKKDLAQIAMAYGYVYVAQIAMGANPEQTLKALREAEAYNGPSLIIAYAPCINHGLKAGMNKSMLEMKKAVRAGYWTLLRYDPEKADRGENPLSLDSAAPSESYKDFIMGEVRFNALKLDFPERAQELFSKGEAMSKERYESLKHRQDSFESGSQRKGDSHNETI